MKKKILIAIPAYNEEKNIGNVLNNLIKSGQDILLIDDGSNDNTTKIASSFDINIIQHKYNKGVSDAYRTFIKYAIKNKYTHIITLDGDGQHNPSLIDKFVNQTDLHDFIIGNRFTKPEKIPIEKISSNFFASLLAMHNFGSFLPDISCGFRAFSVDFISSINIEANNYGIIYQCVFESLLRGITPSYIPMKPNYKNQFLQTNISEIICLFNQTDKMIGKQVMLYYTNLVHKKAPFEITIMDTTFSFKPVNDIAYKIDTNYTNAISFYNENRMY